MGKANTVCPDPSRLFALQIDGQSFPIIWSVIGATVFTLVLAFLNRLFVGRRTRL
ncbi:MAG: hypothetical protein ACFCVB_07130 [Nodosilinea sp.]